MLKKIFGKFGNKGNFAKLKNKGDNNTFYVNSVIKKSLMDEVSELLQQGRHPEAIQLIDRVMKGASSQMPLYPHYLFDISYNVKDGTTISVVPQNQEALDKYPMHGSMSVILPEEYRTKFNDFGELLQYSYEKQIPIEVDAVSFKTMIGDYVLQDFQSSEDGGEAKITISPQEFPPPMPYKFYVMDGSASIDIELALVEIDKGISILNNNHQVSSKLFFELKVDTVKHEVNFFFRTKEEHIRSVEASLMKLTFLHCARNKAIALRNLENDSNLILSRNWNLDNILSDDVDWTINLFKNLYQIENFFGVRFIAPDIITKEDADAIAILMSAIEDRELEGTFSEIKLVAETKEQLESILEIETKKDGVELRAEYKKGHIELFGARFTIRKARVTFRYATIDNPSRLRLKLESFDEGDNISIIFIPVTPQKNICIQKYEITTEEYSN